MSVHKSLLAILLFSVLNCSVIAQNSPSIESLNDQMNELEKLLGIPDNPLKSTTVDPDLAPSFDPIPPKMGSELPPELQGIEKKLLELESMVSDLPESEIVEQVEYDPWDIADSNLTVPIDLLPRVEISSGMVVRYVPQSDSFLAVNKGDLIKAQTLFIIPSNSEMVVSFAGNSSARFSENSRIVIGLPENTHQLIDLRNGTVSAYVNTDGEQDKSTSLIIHTHSGQFESSDAFFAVTEYLGQSYVDIKQGRVKKTPHLSSKSVSYLNKNTIAKRAQPEEIRTEPNSKE